MHLKLRLVYSLFEAPLNYLCDINAIGEVLVTSSSVQFVLLKLIGILISLRAYNAQCTKRHEEV